jgi:MinD-like ATPase involved in chromosome partitioning or flagellar assembly
MNTYTPRPKRSRLSVPSSGFSKFELVGRGRWRSPQPSNLPTRIIAVGAAGPGVGKSTVAANLAIATANLGSQVVLVDLDLASPCQHRLFGVDRSAHGLQALLNHEIKNLDVSFTRTSIRNLHLVTGGDGDSSALLLDREQKRLLMRQIREIESDVVFVDVGAGNREDLLDLFSLGALRLIVATPEPASLESAYGFLKGAALRAVRHFSGDAAQALQGFGGKLIGNQTHLPDEAEIFHAFSRLVAEFLGIPIPVLGSLQASPRISESTANGRPLLSSAAIDENVRAFHLMAESLMNEDVTTATACDLGGSIAVPIGESPLPTSIDPYRRKHPRHQVDWVATLRSEGRETAVRVVDVSLTGAGLEVISPLRVGEAATLLFEQLPGRPALPVMVMSLRETQRRAGVAFSGSDDLPRRLVAAAQSGRSTQDHCRPDLPMF